MSDEMPDEPHNRRWEDIQSAIHNAVQIAVVQAMTTVRLTLDRLDKDVQTIRMTLYGDTQIHQRGALERLDQLETHITQLGQRFDERFDLFSKEIREQVGAVADQLKAQVDEGKARGNQIVGARKAFYFLAAAIMFVGGLPALATFLKALGITP